jgi:hypothetical protein
LAFLLVLFFLPETSHPGTTGMEKCNRRREKQGKSPRRLFWVNPVASLALLRSPNLLAVVSPSYVVSMPVLDSATSDFGRDVRLLHQL